MRLEMHRIFRLVRLVLDSFFCSYSNPIIFSIEMDRRSIEEYRAEQKDPISVVRECNLAFILERTRKTSKYK